MSDNPVVVAPRAAMGHYWAKRNRDRFTRPPRVAVNARMLRGYRGPVVVVTGAPRPWGGPILLTPEMYEEIRYLRHVGCQVEHEVLP